MSIPRLIKTSLVSASPKEISPVSNANCLPPIVFVKSATLTGIEIALIEVDASILSRVLSFEEPFSKLEVFLEG
jgi:hypothetical protein